MLLSVSLFAQSRGNSPYTLYGVGFKSEISNGKSFAMGGVGIAFQDAYSINPLNPASFAAFDSLSFVFDAGFVMNSSKFNTTNASERGSYASLNYLLFGFQVAKPWKTSFGIIPYSDVGYNTVVSGELNGIEFDDLYSGNGGLNKVYSAHAFNITKKLSIGVETGFYFGEIEKNYIRFLKETEYAFHIKEANIDTYKKFYMKYGIQYSTKLNKDINLTLGVIFSTDTKLDTDRKRLIQTVKASSSGLSTPIETFESSIQTGTTLIPKNFGMGFMLSKRFHWKAGLDIEKQYWSDYSSLGQAQPLKNSLRIAAGGELIPKINAFRGYFNKVSYRFGVRYEKTPLYLNNTQLNELGISFGLGLPFARTLTGSTVNFGLEIGQRGTTKDNLIKETFVKFKLGISMHGRGWFRQLRYE